MPPIMDPWHSVPFDGHLWSEHPEIAGLVATLWGQHFTDFDSPPSQAGPKPKAAFQQQFQVLLLNLYVAWAADPDVCVGVPMGVRSWRATSRYNATGVSKKIPELVHRLDDQGLIDLAKGSFAEPSSSGNRTTRIRAADELVALFRTVGFAESNIRRHPEQECIILKDKGEVEYDDTPKANAMRGRLRAYNALLEQSFIDIPELEEPFIDRPITTGSRAGQVDRVGLNQRNKFVRRIFSRGSWELNGRFYGPWWQQIGKEWRSKIFINDTPTNELDFKGLHVAMLSLEAGVKLEGDPYELPPGVIAGVTSQEQRKLVKALVLKAVNARDKDTAFKSFREGLPVGSVGKSMTNADLSRVMKVFLHKHPHLDGKMCADQGIRLMYLDSLISEQIFNFAVRSNVPILGVHDSFIVDYRLTKAVKLLMARAATKVCGGEIEIEYDLMGLDEFKADDPDYIIQSYIQDRQSPRTPGYLSRLAHHEATYGDLPPYTTDNPITAARRRVA